MYRVRRQHYNCTHTGHRPSRTIFYILDRPDETCHTRQSGVYTLIKIKFLLFLVDCSLLLFGVGCAASVSVWGTNDYCTVLRDINKDETVRT